MPGISVVEHGEVKKWQSQEMSSPLSEWSGLTPPSQPHLQNPLHSCRHLSHVNSANLTSLAHGEEGGYLVLVSTTPSNPYYIFDLVYQIWENAVMERLAMLVASIANTPIFADDIV